MADINEPTEAQVISISPDSALNEASADTITINIGLASDYIYAKITRYQMPLTTAWSALTRMWALMAASLILTPVYPESEDIAERNQYQAIVDAWLDGVNDDSKTLTDDAGVALTLATKGADEAPESSTANVLPMYYRPTEGSTVSGPELTQETADTAIEEATGEDNY